MIAETTLLLAAALAQDPPKEPPSITYGPSRSSNAWVQKPGGGALVAVDEGVEWQGVKVYISLTYDLLGVDAKTGKTIWAADIGAFWNRVGFKEVEVAPGRKVWAVELKPGPRERQGQDRVQVHDLRTGKLIPTPEPAPAGTAFKPRAEWHGPQSGVGKAFRLVATTEENWKKVADRMFEGQKRPEFGRIDFESEVVLVVSDGDSWNCNGISCGGAWEDGARILVRLHRHTYQTAGPDGGGVRVRPFGIFVLPRRAEKGIVVEGNFQRYIAGPPLWKETFRLEKLGDSARELDALPNP